MAGFQKDRGEQDILALAPVIILVAVYFFKRELTAPQHVHTLDFR